MEFRKQIHKRRLFKKVQAIYEEKDLILGVLQTYMYLFSRLLIFAFF